MTSTLAAGSPTARNGPLASLRAGLLDTARHEADQRRQDAVREAEATVEATRAEVDEAKRQARRAGELAAQRRAAGRVAAARRAARARVLAAERAAYDELAAASMSAVTSLRGADGYDDLLDRLEARARSLLGPGATIHRDPPEGGVVAELDHRRVDLTLPTLASRCLAEVLARSEEVPW